MTAHPPHVLVYPMLALVALSATVLVILFTSRVRAVNQRKVSPRYFAIYQGEAEPESSAKASRHFSNLFEAPTLFYAVCLAAMVTQQVGSAMLTLAWLYVAARTAHAAIHLTVNRLPLRIPAYFTGWAILLAMWILLAVRVSGTA